MFDYGYQRGRSGILWQYDAGGNGAAPQVARPGR